MSVSIPQNVIRERQRNVADGFAGLDSDGRIAAPIKMGSVAELGVLAAGVLAVETTGGSLNGATAISLRVGDGSTAGGIKLGDLAVVTQKVLWETLQVVWQDAEVEWN